MKGVVASTLARKPIVGTSVSDDLRRYTPSKMAPVITMMSSSAPAAMPVFLQKELQWVAGQHMDFCPT
jgi:hypothetical protein